MWHVAQGDARHWTKFLGRIGRGSTEAPWAMGSRSSRVDSCLKKRNQRHMSVIDDFQFVYNWYPRWPEFFSAGGPRKSCTQQSFTVYKCSSIKQAAVRPLYFLSRIISAPVTVLRKLPRGKQCKLCRCTQKLKLLTGTSFYCFFRVWLVLYCILLEEHSHCAQGQWSPGSGRAIFKNLWFLYNK